MKHKIFFRIEEEKGKISLLTNQSFMTGYSLLTAIVDNGIFNFCFFYNKISIHLCLTVGELGITLQKKDYPINKTNITWGMVFVNRVDLFKGTNSFLQKQKTNNFKKLSAEVKELHGEKVLKLVLQKKIGTFGFLSALRIFETAPNEQIEEILSATNNPNIFHDVLVLLKESFSKRKAQDIVGFGQISVPAIQKLLYFKLWGNPEEIQESFRVFLNFSVAKKHKQKIRESNSEIPSASKANT